MKKNLFNPIMNLSFPLLGLSVFFWAYHAGAYTPQDCLKCHRQGSKGSTLHISSEKFATSIHREMMCQDCHTGVHDEDHIGIKGSGRVDCNECHSEENKHGLQSQSEYRPTCYACHTKHGILEKDNVLSAVHSKNLKETCKRCHPLECGEVDYLSWLPSMQIASHKKQDFSQAYERDNCLGCHQGLGAHGEEGTLNDQTCYTCHFSPEGRSALWGYIHPQADLEKQPTIFAAATLYQIFIVLLLWGGFRFYIRKLSKKR